MSARFGRVKNRVVFCACSGSWARRVHKVAVAQYDACQSALTAPSSSCAREQSNSECWQHKAHVKVWCVDSRSLLLRIAWLLAACRRWRRIVSRLRGRGLWPRVGRWCVLAFAVCGEFWMIGVVVLPHRDVICGLDGGRACGGGLDMCRRGGSELFDEITGAQRVGACRVVL